MLNHRNFWYAQMAALLAFYGAALLLALQGHGMEHLAVRVAVIFLAVHVLEIPLAFYLLKGRKPRTLRVVLGTLLFGLIWWLPARRGLLAVE